MEVLHLAANTPLNLPLATFTLELGYKCQLFSWYETSHRQPRECECPKDESLSGNC
jgi:hypothetical protein